MLHFYQQRMSIPISPYLQQHLLFPSFLITAILEGAKQYLIMVLIYICLMTNDGDGNGNPLQYSCLENPHGPKSLAGYSPWGRKESDTTELLTTKPQ